MKKTIKSFAFIAIAVVLCISAVMPVLASTNIPEATSDFYVNDFANVFSEEEKNKLMDNAVSLANENDGIQVVVTTVKSLEGSTVEDYAYDMYNKYGIGKNDRGLLILLSTGDRKIRVEVGKSMEAYINDSKAGRFMDKHAIPYLKADKFNVGLISLQEALISEIKTCVANEANSSIDTSSKPNVDFAVVFGVLGAIVFAGLIVFVVILIVKKAKEKKEYIVGLNTEIKKLRKNEEELKTNHAENIRKLTFSIEELEREKSRLVSRLGDTKKELDILKDRHQRTLKIYPDADQKVDDMIKAELTEKDKRIAAELDNEISAIINMPPSRLIVDEVNTLIIKYSALTEDQRKYVRSDIKTLKDFFEKSLKLRREYERKVEEERLRRLTEQRKTKASNVTKEILGIIALVGIARASDLSRLRNAKRLYDSLDSETQRYVDRSAINELNSLVNAAKRAKDEEEEQERRRRNASTYSSSSFRSSSSHFGGSGFGGFGGRSGGGGSSRGF